jgi:hypothetical protein
VPLLGKYSIILQRGGVWREKHHLGIGMKITNKRRICKSCNNNKQNPEKRFLQIDLLHYAAIAIQKGLLLDSRHLKILFLKKTLYICNLERGKGKVI